MQNFDNISSESSGGGSYDDAEDTPEIKAAKANRPEPEEFTWSEKDIMLYNLGIGAKADDLKWVYENADGFAVSHIRQVRLMGSHYPHSESSLSSELPPQLPWTLSQISTRPNSFTENNTSRSCLLALSFLALPQSSTRFS
jgi:hypothetical protein